MRAEPVKSGPSGGAELARKGVFLMLAACSLAGLVFAVMLVRAASDSQALADACPNAAFRKAAGAHLPGCRAYEQVSPVDKNGGDVLWLAGGASGATSAAENGSRATFTALTEFAGATHGGSQSPTTYLSRRGPGGWTTGPMVPRPEPVAAGADVSLSSLNLDFSLLASTGVLTSTPPDGSVDEVNLYLRDNGVNLVRPLIGISDDSSVQPFFAPVASPGLDRLVFASPALLTDDPGIPGTFDMKVYEKVGDQPVRLVSVAPDNTPVPTGTQPGGSSQVLSQAYSTVGTVSDDGRHIFFSALDGLTPTAIYRRTDGTVTALVSPSKRTPADPEGERAKEYRFATPDGDRVFFTSAELLTDDANTGPGPDRPGSDLYRYDVSDDELIDISVVPGGNGAEVVGVVGFGDAGDRVYYIARGDVANDGPGGDPDPVPGAPNLYLWEDDGTAGGSNRFIATLSEADSTNWLRLDGNWTARSTPDGNQLVFQSQASIPGPGPDGPSQVYRYDAEAGAGELTCVSCNPNDDTPIGPSSIPDHVLTLTVQRWELPRALSDDGSRVFFNSQDALVPGDSNGEIDAYMWEDGEVSLLSTGISDTESRFFNASANGDDAFILTAEPLVPQDVDDLVDLYNAKVGGGFPSPPPRVECEADGCQGQNTPGPPAGDAGSVDLQGRGDPVLPVRLKLGLKRPSQSQLGKLARGRKIGVRVRVNRAVRVRALLRHGGHRVASGSASASKSGFVVVRMRLNRQTVRRLKRVETMRLSLSVRVSGARSRTMALRLKGTR